MNFEAVKEKLHDYIEHADQNKIMAMFTLLQGEIDAVSYDDLILNSLESTRNGMVSGSEKTYTLEQTIENIRRQRKNGI